MVGAQDVKKLGQSWDSVISIPTLLFCLEEKNLKLIFLGFYLTFCIDLLKQVFGHYRNYRHFCQVDVYVAQWFQCHGFP